MAIDGDPFFDGSTELDDECYECGGEGWIVDGCFEDTCCCADPETQHDVIPCPVCNYLLEEEFGPKGGPEMRALVW